MRVKFSCNLSDKCCVAPPRATNFHVAVSRGRFYFFQHEDFFSTEVLLYVRITISTGNATLLPRQVVRKCRLCYLAFSTDLRLSLLPLSLVFLVFRDPELMFLSYDCSVTLPALSIRFSECLSGCY